MIFAGTPESGNPRSQFARFSDARVKAKIASDKGAKGLIIISSEENFADEKAGKTRIRSIARRNFDSGDYHFALRRRKTFGRK